MKTIFIFLFFILNSFVSFTNLHSAIPEEFDQSIFIELGQIEGVGIPFYDEKDQIIGNRYYLDTGSVLLDPSGGIITTRWNGEEWVTVGGIWASGEHLFIKSEYDLISNDLILIYNAERNEYRPMYTSEEIIQFLIGGYMGTIKI